MKSEPLLSDFSDYCKKNPEERFWQALRNWSNFSAIFGGRVEIDHELGIKYVATRNTFNMTDKGDPDEVVSQARL